MSDCIPYHGHFDCAGRYIDPPYPPRFPVEVPPRPTAGIRNAPEGVDEGAMCLRAFGPGLASVCLARLVLEPEPDMGGCSCFISAPCGSCMSRAPECPKGCWRDESRP